MSTRTTIPVAQSGSPVATTSPAQASTGEIEHYRGPHWQAVRSLQRWQTAVKRSWQAYREADAAYERVYASWLNDMEAHPTQGDLERRLADLDAAYDRAMSAEFFWRHCAAKHYEAAERVIQVWDELPPGVMEGEIARAQGEALLAEAERIREVNHQKWLAEWRAQLREREAAAATA